MGKKRLARNPPRVDLKNLRFFDHLIDMPVEILVNIFTFVDTWSLFKIATLCTDKKLVRIAIDVYHDNMIKRIEQLYTKYYIIFSENYSERINEPSYREELLKEQNNNKIKRIVISIVDNARDNMLKHSNMLTADWLSLYEMIKYRREKENLCFILFIRSKPTSILNASKLPDRHITRINKHCRIKKDNLYNEFVNTMVEVIFSQNNDPKIELHYLAEETDWRGEETINVIPPLCNKYVIHRLYTPSNELIQSYSYNLSLTDYYLDYYTPFANNNVIKGLIISIFDIPERSTYNYKELVSISKCNSHRDTLTSIWNSWQNKTSVIIDEKWSTRNRGMWYKIVRRAWSPKNNLALTLTCSIESAFLSRMLDLPLSSLWLSPYVDIYGDYYVGYHTRFFERTWNEMWEDYHKSKHINVNTSRLKFLTIKLDQDFDYHGNLPSLLNLKNFSFYHNQKFTNIPSLLVLDLEGVPFGHLPSHAFTPLPNLRVLRIGTVVSASPNALAGIDSLRFFQYSYFGGGTFDNFTSILVNFRWVEKLDTLVFNCDNITFTRFVYSMTGPKTRRTSALKFINLKNLCILWKRRRPKRVNFKESCIKLFYANPTLEHIYEFDNLWYLLSNTPYNLFIRTYSLVDHSKNLVYKNYDGLIYLIDLDGRTIYHVVLPSTNGHTPKHLLSVPNFNLKILYDFPFGYEFDEYDQSFLFNEYL